jgi:hypothetical protein
MSLPPLTPESIRGKAHAYLKVQNFKTEDSVVRYAEAQGFTLAYLRECLLEHFESGRKVYQKWKPDGSALIPECVMQLNLELSETEVRDLYLQLAIVNHGREMLMLLQIHSHTTTPLPR